MSYRDDLISSLREMASRLRAEQDARRLEIAEGHLQELESDGWASLKTDEIRHKLDAMKSDFYVRSWEPSDWQDELYKRIVRLIDTYRYNLK